MADTVTSTWGVGGRTNTVKVIRTLAAAGDYAAEDVLSDSASAGTAITFTSIARGNKSYRSGYITKAVIDCSTTGLTPRLALYLYNVTPTSGELDDNKANTSVHTTDRPNFVGRIDFPAMEDLGGNSETVATTSTPASNLPLAYTTPDGNLYGILVTRDAITGEAAGMTIQILLTSEMY